MKTTIDPTKDTKESISKEILIYLFIIIIFKIIKIEIKYGKRW